MKIKKESIKMKEFPNILLIVTDCARSDKWVGKRRTTFTPNLDRLRHEGITFPTTITEKSVTTPSLATLLSGRYSPRHGIHQVWGYKLSDHIPLLTRVLSEFGYHTYAEVSGPLVAEMGLDRGFDEYEYRAPCDYLHSEWGDQFVKRLENGHYKKPWFLMLHLWELHTPRVVLLEKRRLEYGRDEYERSVSSLDAQLGRVFDSAGKESFIIFTGDHGEKTKKEKYQKGTAVDYAQDFLGIDKAGGLALYQVASWAGPSVLQQLYAASVLPSLEKVNSHQEWEKPDFSWRSRISDLWRLLRLSPKLTLPDLFMLNRPLKLTAMMKRRGLLDEKVSQKKVKRFLQCCDRDKLTEMQTRMLINSYRKNIEEGHIIHVYDYLVKVPLVMRWCGRLPSGISYQRMTRLPDILPTVLDLIGIEKEKVPPSDGKSFKHLIEGNSWKPNPAYLSVSGPLSELEIRGVRTEKFKYTYGPKNPELPDEFYNLLEDPDETKNLAKEEPEKCTQMRILAESLLPETGPQSVEKISVVQAQQQNIEGYLRELGYID
jgi:arylsulfatase A-like enzyme